MNASRYAHVLGFALGHPWALLPEMRLIMATTLARHIAGIDSAEQIDAALVNRKNLPQPRAGSVAVIPVYGLIAPRMNMMSALSGGTTYSELTGQLRDALSAKDVRTIVLDIDSPGGSVAGCAEFAAEVLRARTKKPIIAQAQFTAGSAAYYIAASATEIVAAPSARVGGVGTVLLHRDLSKALGEMGVKTTIISAGEGKADGNEAEPLSEAAQARMQASVDEAYANFVAGVVRGRGKGMTSERVRKDWKAHVYSAPEALSIGMIDTVATLDETLARLLDASPDVADKRAAIDLLPAHQPDPIPAAAVALDYDLERLFFELSIATSTH